MKMPAKVEKVHFGQIGLTPICTDQNLISAKLSLAIIVVPECQKGSARIHSCTGRCGCSFDS